MRPDSGPATVQHTASSQRSLEACDEALEPAVHEESYCPVRMLNQFALLMAGQGRCISTSLMLADREYALWQVARAYATDDEDLRALASHLFAWFEARPSH